MDEDVYGAVAPALRRAAIDALSTTEAGRVGESDESQLDWASNENRTWAPFATDCLAYRPNQILPLAPGGPNHGSDAIVGRLEEGRAEAV